MAITVNDVQNNVNQYIGDTGTNSVSANDRLRAITEAVKEMKIEVAPIADRTFDFDFFDTVNYYNITSDVDDFLSPVELNYRFDKDQGKPFTYKDPGEIRAEINLPEESSYSVEIRGNKRYLVLSHSSKELSAQLHDADSVTANGTWAVDSTNSDATNLTADTVEFMQGSASLNFDVDVSQSGNDRATISISDMSQVDLTKHEDLSSWIMEAYIPDVTNFTSFTVYWGSDSSNYWSATATTDIGGSAFVAGWNTVKVDWADATKTSSPDVSAIDYLRIDLNYAGGQGDDTDFRIDHIRMVKPEKLRLYYQSWDVGETSTSDSTRIKVFGATTNVPYFSGLFDHLDVYVGHKAAAILFRQMRDFEAAREEDREAELYLKKVDKRFPQTKQKQVKNFKVSGINHNR